MGSIRFVLKYMKPYRGILMLLIGMYFFQTLLTTIQPIILSPVINIVLNSQSGVTASPEPVTLQTLNLNNAPQFISQILGLDVSNAWETVVFLAVLYFLTTVAVSIVDFVSLYLRTRVRVSSFRDMQYDLFGHLLSLSLDFFHHQRTGGIMSRFENDTRNSVEDLAQTLQTLFTAPVVIIFYGYMLIKTDITLTLLVGVAAAAQGVVARGMRAMIRARVHDQFDVVAEASSYIQEVFTNFRVIKSFAAEKFEGSRFRAMIDRMLPIHLRFAIFKHVQGPLNASITGLTNGIILLLAAKELLDGDLTVAGFALFLFLGRAILGPINQLSQVYTSLQAMGASVERVMELFNAPPLVSDGGIQVDDFKDVIRFENVSFAYDTEYVLRDVSFTIEHGQVVALVGPSGAGKSTITDLLMRFYDPSSGVITMDGHNLRDLDLTYFRRLFGVVAQENLLFNATISDNIAYSRSYLSADQIQKAAEVANAAAFIKQTPQGYETFIGDRGVLLSGGQRQRLAIARAIADKPPLLIMDEATSSLDTESERIVQEAIDRAIEGTTALVIAHRLSTVVNADKIIVLEQGRAIDQGTHKELIERCALYKRLCELQFQSGLTISTQDKQ